MNETIEERALINFAYEYDFCGRDLSKDMVCRAYMKGAKEQKDIDDIELLKLKSELEEKEAQINQQYKQGYNDAINEFCEWLDTYFMEIDHLDNYLRDFSNILIERERFKKQ